MEPPQGSKFSNLPQQHYNRFYPPPPPPRALTPPSASHPEVQEKQEHALNGPHSDHSTPVIRNHGDSTPYQRISSTYVPNQGPAPPPLERIPIDNVHPQPLYAARPPHSDHHMMYPSPQHYLGPPPMMEHGYAPYFPYPPSSPSQGHMCLSKPMTNPSTRRKVMRATTVGKPAR